MAVLGLVGASAPAHADTLVYVKDQQVYLSQADGSQARPVTPASEWWAWPSQSDGGTIAVAGGAARVNPGGTTESSGSSEIYAFDQQGNSLLATPVETPGSVSGPTAPTYVDHFRVSPDGSTVAYDVIGCCGASGETTFLSPLQSGADWSPFRDDYVSPGWVDGSAAIGTANALALTHNGATIGDQAEYGIVDAANAANATGWRDDTAIPDGWEYQASFTRNTGVLALFLDDAADTGGTVQHARIHLELINPDRSETDACTLELPAAQYAQPRDRARASVSFTTDGTTMAWGQADGIYEANVSNPADCAAITTSTHLAVPGGSMPSFSPAALSPQSASGGPETTITKHPPKVLKTKRAKAKVKFKFGSAAAGASFECKLGHKPFKRCRSPYKKKVKPGKYKFKVRAKDAAGATGRVAKFKFKVKRKKGSGTL